jgi:hypothetical protein
LSGIEGILPIEIVSARETNVFALLRRMIRFAVGDACSEPAAACLAMNRLS